MGVSINVLHGKMNPIKEQALEVFLTRVRQHYDVQNAWLFGSEARQLAHTDSDVDIALLLSGDPGSRTDIAVEMAGIAFDVMLETGVLVDPLPLWEDEWKHPEHFNNPRLLANIQRDGIRL